MMVVLWDQTRLIDSTYIQLSLGVITYCYGEVVTVGQLSMSHCFQIDGLESECDGDGDHPGKQDVCNC